MARDMTASWYESGTVRADGKPFHPDEAVCANKKLPIGTKLRVTYAGRTTDCTVLDRGPYVRGRQLDLSRGVARRLHFTGVHPVQVQVR